MNMTKEDRDDCLYLLTYPKKVGHLLISTFQSPNLYYYMWLGFFFSRHKFCNALL